MTLFDDLRAHRAAQRRRILDLFDDPARAEAFSAARTACCSTIPRPISTRRRWRLLIGWPRRRMCRAARGDVHRREGSTRRRGGPYCTPRFGRRGSGLVDGVDVMPGVLETRARMEAFAMDVRSGAIAGAGGPYTDVVNIGIGGSDLGPAMATLALAPYHDGPRLHYVSNVDGAHIHDTLKGLDPRGRW
jgi:glucose-6-phosphate isomerase